MFKDLFMSKAKKEQLAAEQRELQYRQSCDAADRTRWASVSDQQLTLLRSAMYDVYTRAKNAYSSMKKPYGLSSFYFENLFGPDEVLSVWKSDYYSAKKRGFGTHDPGLERRMYAKLRLSYEFYRANMRYQEKDKLYSAITAIDQYIERFCCMEVEDAAEVFMKRYPY